MQDTVVGYAYAIASRVAGDNAKAIGANDEFGGLGRNGTQNTSEACRTCFTPPARLISSRAAS
jgi:hypothetical protein